MKKYFPFGTGIIRIAFYVYIYDNCTYAELIASR